MPRSLRGRLFGAFLILALAILATVGGALFVVLRGLHAEETEAGLRGIAATVLPQVRESIANGDFRGTVLEIHDRLAAGETRVETYIVGVSGQLRGLDGTIADGRITLPADAAPNATLSGGTTIDGARYAYAATVLRQRALAGKAVAFVTLDRSDAQALADVVRRLPAVLLIGALVGGILAWLLAQSVTKPLSRLAEAAAGLPAGPVAALPLEGPAEIRTLTGTFNAIAAELAELRTRESELLADLRHDLRTPLTVIGGYAAALADGTATGDDAARAARAIEEEAARLERLVSELGALERLREGSAGLRPEQLDAGTLLAATRDRFSAAAMGAGVSLEVSVPPPTENLGFAADRLAVERILGNLVANALAAASADALVSTSADPAVAGSTDPAAGHVWLGARAMTTADGSPAIALTVTDDGPGFPPGVGARVFERFFRADPSRSGGGAGLGLAIVCELAEAHGGSAHAENVAPRGARVSVVLPVVPRLQGS